MKYILSITIAFLFCCSIKTNAQSELLRRDIYDFEIGDSLYYDSWWYYPGTKQHRENLQIITSKNYNIDSTSVTYRSSDIIKTYWLDNSAAPILISNSNSEYTINDLDSTYIEGFSNVLSQYQAQGVSERMTYDSSNIFWNVDSSYGADGYKYSNNSWDAFEIGFAKGVGTTRKAESKEFDNSSQGFILLAYHKANGKKWGTINTKDFISSVEENVSSQLKIYPNPVSNVLTIEHLDITASGIATIFSLDGVPVQKQTIEKGTNQIDVSSLASGIYFLLIQTNEGAVQQRIVKF